MRGMGKKALIVGVVLTVLGGAFVVGVKVGKRTTTPVAATVAPPAASAPPAAKPAEPAIASDEEFAEAVSRLKHGGLVLPARLFIVADTPFSIYWHNIVPVKDPEVFSYDVTCDGCSFTGLERRRITLTPKAADVGPHRIVITVRKPNGEVVEERPLDVTVVPATAGANHALNILMVGDSLGHQSRFPNELSRLLAGKANPKATFVGTHRPGGAIIPHEQYGGWTYQSFLVNYDLDPKVYHVSASPFLFKDGAGQPTFDMKRYINEKIGGVAPDYVHIQLGTNDCFGLDPASPTLDGDLDKILANADQLIAGIRSALPNAMISIGTVIPANSSDRSYTESYKVNPFFYSEWRYRQVQMALARKQMAHYQGREGEKLYSIPTHLGLDALDGYSAHDFVPTEVTYRLSHAVHPVPSGDRQVAAAIYGFLKGSYTVAAKH